METLLVHDKRLKPSLQPAFDVVGWVQGRQKLYVGIFLYVASKPTETRITKRFFVVAALAAFFLRWKPFSSMING